MSTSAAGNNFDEDDEVLVIDGLGRRTTFTRRSVKHMIVGAILGFVLSLTLSSILYEIARDLPFAIVDILVLFAACVVLFMKQFRAAQGMGDKAVLSSAVSFEAPESRMLAVVRIGAACVGSAAVCVILVIATSLPALVKFFLVMNIAASHCYLLCLGSVEFFNAFFNNGAPLIARQLYTVAIASVAVGCASGFLFGAADVERNLERLAWEEWIAAVLCMLTGAAVGHANSVAVDDQMEIAFDPLPMDDVADDSGSHNANNHSNSAVGGLTAASTVVNDEE